MLVYHLFDYIRDYYSAQNDYYSPQNDYYSPQNDYEGLVQPSERLLQPPRPTYSPQTDYLKLVSLGRRRAIAEKWGISLNLPGMWALKRHIDFDFMKDN